MQNLVRLNVAIVVLNPLLPPTDDPRTAPEMEVKTCYKTARHISPEATMHNSRWNEADTFYNFNSSRLLLGCFLEMLASYLNLKIGGSSLIQQCWPE